MKIDRFPIYRYDKIFNKFDGKLINDIQLKYSSLEISYPCRLDAMAINPSAVCYNNDMIFTPGEVVISTQQYIKVQIKQIKQKRLKLGNDIKRKVLVKHAYCLMKKVIKFKDGLEINVIDDVPKHCGFGSSSSTIAAVASAINEMYNHPISNEDLIKYLASNHGEEVSDDNENDLKMVQCIGGGATNGLIEEGIIIITGKSTPICKMKYYGDIIIGIPKNFEVKDAKYLMEKEEENLWKFKETGDKYSKEIAYNLLHKAIPGMLNNNLKDLADIIFDYRFNMGSIENCSFVYEPMVEEGKIFRKLYENHDCELLALSSVGPAYFAIVKDSKQKKKCIEEFKKNNMKVIKSSICNTTYKINDSIKQNTTFWNEEKIIQEFTERPCSKYITDEIDKIIPKNSNCIDIGCGGGRYCRYLKKKNINVIGLDKYSCIAASLNKDNIPFYEASFQKLPFRSEKFDNALCIGVLHNAVTPKELIDGINEIYRVLKPNGHAIISIFTNNIITDDLEETSPNCYNVTNRQPMVLYSENEINDFFEKSGFKIIKVIDKHITDVGNRGARYVYSFVVVK